MTGAELQRHLDLAREHHRAGRLREAEGAYRAVLAAGPGMDEVMGALAQVLFVTGRAGEAVEWLRSAVAIKPEAVEYRANLGMVLSALGRFDEAIAACREALAIADDSAEVWNNLGNALREKKRPAEAEQALRRAVALKPGYAAAMSNLGVVLQEQGKLDEAIAAFERAVELGGDHPKALFNLGNALLVRERFAEAAAVYRGGLEREGGAGDAEYLHAYNNLGTALREQALPQEAVAVLEGALKLEPNDAETHVNLAHALRDVGDLESAARASSEALRLRPGWEPARYSLAITRLLQGDFPRGWPDAEARWQRRVVRPEYPDRLLWDGSNLAGRNILLHADHGLGDTIQFVRYAPLLEARGARVQIRCQPELVRLLESLGGVDGVIGNDQPAPDFDVHFPLIGLPRLLGTTVQTIPAPIPYLAADSQASSAWRSRMMGEPGGMKIGLTWAGSPAFREDRFRSPHLAAFAPLAGVAGVRFYSLQKGPAAAEAASAPAGLTIVDWSDELNDFADTAALIDSLDLVISSDTAVVHLAGAMGKPVWVLLHHAPGFFWMMEREDSPWYPTMRLFRQAQPADWGPVVQRVALELGH